MLLLLLLSTFYSTMTCIRKAGKALRNLTLHEKVLYSRICIYFRQASKTIFGVNITAVVQFYA